MTIQSPELFVEDMVSTRFSLFRSGATFDKLSKNELRTANKQLGLDQPISQSTLQKLDKLLKQGNEKIKEDIFNLFLLYNLFDIRKQYEKNNTFIMGQPLTELNKKYAKECYTAMQHMKDVITTNQSLIENIKNKNFTDELQQYIKGLIPETTSKERLTYKKLAFSTYQMDTSLKMPKLQSQIDQKMKALEDKYPGTLEPLQDLFAMTNIKVTNPTENASPEKTLQDQKIIENLTIIQECDMTANSPIIKETLISYLEIVKLQAEQETYKTLDDTNKNLQLKTAFQLMEVIIQNMTMIKTREYEKMIAEDDSTLPSDGTLDIGTYSKISLPDLNELKQAQYSLIN